MATASPEARVLLATFSPSLAANLKTKLDRPVSAPSSRRRIDVDTLINAATRVYEAGFSPARLIGQSDLSQLIAGLTRAAGLARAPEVVDEEWHEIVDARDLRTWDAYRSVKRLGRKTRLGEQQRRTLWGVFDAVWSALKERGQATSPMILHRVSTGGGASAYDFVIVDEAQDISVPEQAALLGLAGARPDALFFAGDLGQRIFQTPFS